jgi:multidrug efflux pump
MIGEATLAMLYVPLFFYIFDKLSERSAAKKEPEAHGGSPPPLEQDQSLEEH